MPIRRQRLLVVLGSAIVLTVAVAWVVFGWSSGMDAAREQAVRTSVDTYYEQHHWHGSLEDSHPNQGVRWFCAGQVIESDANQQETAVGILEMCQEFVAMDGELIVGSGEAAPRLVTVTSPPKPVDVLRVEAPGDGSRYSPWVDANFSWIGVRKLHWLQQNSVPDLENATVVKARTAFGLPADAPVHR
ncbi:hypothetical protein ABZ345_46400 [Lentzea sp. NPDC005914]|uniref:hypothetical protein n=1 Tax=Lentzea sp. NPDC005914 TaxID=3154572 RepID=UPI0033CB064D